MNRFIFSWMLSCLFLTGSLASVMAKSTTPSNKGERIGVNLVDRDGYSVEGLKDNSGMNNQDVNEALSVSDNLPEDANALKIKSSEIKVLPSFGSYLGGCVNEDYYVQISGACFGNGWDISSVTICGVEVCHIILQSSNTVVVYPNAGTPGAGDIVITSESIGKTTIKNAFTYQIPVMNERSKNIKFLNTDDKLGSNIQVENSMEK